MEGKLYLFSLLCAVASILFYKFLIFIKKSEEEDGGTIVQVTIGIWSGILALALLSIIFFLQAFFKLN
jgi:hypothetical protein